MARSKQETCTRGHHMAEPNLYHYQRPDGPVRVCKQCVLDRPRHSRTYQAWADMKSRCSNPRQPKFAYYGGRGITVCERWLKFENFLADMGEAPEGLTLDRINNDGNYEPSNCRWATRFEQSNNTRLTSRITFNGATLSRSEWARRLGISSDTLAHRLKRGWPLEKALHPGDKR